MKTCFKCNEAKPLSQYYRHPRMGDGHLNKCIECTKRDVAAHRAANIDKVQKYDRERFQRPERKRLAIEYQRRMRASNPEKRIARQAISNAIRDGRLTRQPCEVCADIKSEAHHEDYSRPLDVRWLCFKHHRQAHGQAVA